MWPFKTTAPTLTSSVPFKEHSEFFVARIAHTGPSEFPKLGLAAVKTQLSNELGRHCRIGKITLK